MLEVSTSMVIFFQKLKRSNERVMVPEVIATTAAKLFLGEVAQSAALELGNSVVKTSIERLKHLIRYGLAGKPALEQGDIGLLKNAILEIYTDEPDSLFSVELRTLVRQMQPDASEGTQVSIENSTVGAVAQNISGGQSIGTFNGGVAAEHIDNFHFRNND